MKFFNIKIYLLVGILFLLVINLSCDDKFDDHYDVNSSIVPSISLIELIEQQDDLSDFYFMLKNLGLDSKLSSDFSYTVWAPVNAVMNNLNLNTFQDSLNFVNNHIARFAYDAIDNIDESKKILMNSGKKILFKGSKTQGYIFGDAKLIRYNLLSKSGVLHILDNRNDYAPNIWERMEGANLDSIRNYLYSLTKVEFDYGNSILDGYDTLGMPIYDSAFRYYNPWWDAYPLYISGISSLIQNPSVYFDGGFYPVNNEDSIYTMILPTNEAWIEAYERIAPYFKGNEDAENADSIQRVYTQFALVKDLVFRGEIDKESLTEDDILYSTRLDTISNPVALFENTEMQDASNGKVYVANKLNYRSTDSWFRPMQLEGEGGYFDVPPKSSSINTNIDENKSKVFSTEFPGVSRGYYYYLVASSPGTVVTADFYVPNNLSASYKITAGFVPDNLQNSNDPREITVTARVEKYDFSSKRWVIEGKASSPKDVIKTDDTTKIILFDKFEFTYAFINKSIAEEDDEKRKYSYRIRISTQDRQRFLNRMGIDYVLLEPIEN